MELRQIKYFIEVAKREHVTDAAMALHVAQSAVSRQIFNLESELGVNLFIREGRNVKLTPIGKIFLEQMEEAIKVIDNAKRQVREYLDPEQGRIRFGFPSSLALYTLPSIISAFRERYPHVKFELKQSSYRDLISGVAEGEIDMALIGPLPKQERKVKGDILFTENMVALLPSAHPLADKPLLKLDHLKDESFILFPKGYVLREIFDHACSQLGFHPKVSFEGDDIDTIKGLVSAGLGLTLIPESTLADSLPRSTAMLPVINPQVTRTVGIIIPSERQLLPTEKLFYHFIRDFFAVLNQFQN
ncbi:LysR family transcriptional regulator [Cytobacillus firmus]|uniref:LysR family transcriptional regulator n=1 Tax=Cytobacillus firmus TaxID=1399 RepID=UPI001C8E6894|nr:LysR family transcriptional regulator [Cytobacillus firmus]MBX9971676.1 LysR family transcriptional regulator [Cytobacillus firmus]